MRTHQTLTKNPKQTVTQMVPIQLSGPQTKYKDMNVGKELVGRRGVDMDGREMREKVGWSNQNSLQTSIKLLKNKFN